MVNTRITTDIGKGEGKLDFLLEKKIKEYQEGVDYVVDETGDVYTVISERLKKIVWPNEYYPYDESIVTIDRQGIVKRMGFVSSKENSNDPNKWFREKGSKEILERVNKIKEGKSFCDSFSIVKKEDFSQSLTKQPNKNDKALWIIGGLLFLAPLTYFFVRNKKVICQRKSKKNYESKQ